MSIADPTIVWKLNVANGSDLLWSILGYTIVIIAGYWIWYTEYKLEKDLEGSNYGV